MKKIILAAFAIALLSVVSFAQPRPMPSGNTADAVKPAPNEFKAQYIGGLIGFTSKEEGTLRFDDANRRLVFFGEEKKERFSIPYDSLVAIYPQSKSVTTTAGQVVSHIPLPGAGLAGLIKEKRRYLVTQFDDPDMDVKGLANFKLENKELLDSVLATLAEKAKLTQRGDAYYRPRSVKSDG